MSKQPYRNQNHQFRSQPNINRMPNFGPDHTNENRIFTEERFEQDTRYQCRVFHQGKEADSESEHQSIYEQRAHANQRQRQTRYNPRGRFTMHNRNTNRGRQQYSKARRTFNDGGSDTDSVSSSEFQSRIGGHHFGFGVNQQLNVPIDNTGNNYWKSSDVNEVIEKNPEIDKKNNDSFKHPDKTKVSQKEKMEAVRNFRHYQSILNKFEPTELIMECRQEIDEIAKDAIMKHLGNIEQIKSRLNNCDVFKLHLENLVQQQKVFEDCIADMKGKLSSILATNNQSLIDEIENVKDRVKEECKLFKRSLPGYACKNNILQSIKNNKVTVVSTDSNYFLNMLLPIFAKAEYTNHSLICCESNELLRSRLRRNIFHLLYDKIEMNDTDQFKINNLIQFLIERELLNLFSNDYTFDENNMFVVINVALKRSIDLDIVLTNLRDMLKQKNNSKVVLLCSVYDHSLKYESYFGKSVSVEVVSFPSLNLPVKSVWKCSALLPSDDYIAEEVKTILAIHTLNAPGDIMAFFPTLTDVKSASSSLNQKLFALQYKDTECVLLHETSTNKHGLDLSSKKNSSKQTIYLVTDCAEMLVIPSVCYVVDCGLRKEYMFDSSKKLDVLTTTFVSRDKCKLRKSLAGSFTKGIYYRLYNKENYRKEMPRSEYPELLTMNPFNIMIKVFQHRPNDAATVDFVECLPNSTKENALKLLIKCKAIKDNYLTSVGKNIVKLPFPVKYSKLILFGIQWGLAYEAVVLVAFFSVKGRVFQYSPKIETQRAIDSAKLQLVQGDSDTLSYLHIYRLWLENDSSSVWCENHQINFETLKSVYLKVNEICHVVGEALKENITQEFSSMKNSTLTLVEMLFECFQNDLCVFTGHYRSGYRVLSSHCIAFLHPSSTICQMENLPQFIIFDHMITTTRDFLVSITSIPNDLVMKALSDLEFDYSDMFEKSLVQRVIEPVGERMIKQVLLGKKGKKLTEIEAQIKKALPTTSLVIEPVPGKGQVLVYALEIQADEAVKLVKEILKSQLEDILNSEEIHVLELKRGNIKIPVEIKWLKGAFVDYVKTERQGKSLVTIQNNFDDEINPTEQLPCIIQQSINLTWVRRRCNGKGFVTFHGSDFMSARKLAMKSIPFRNSDVFVELSRNAQNQLFISDLPPDAKNSELENAILYKLPGVRILNVELKFIPPFETSQNQREEIKSNIEENCRKCTKLTNFSVVVPLPKSSATTMKAYVNATEEEDIIEAAVNLSKCTVGDYPLTSKPVFRSIVKTSLELCCHLRERFQDTLKELQQKMNETYKLEELFDFEINKMTDDMAAIKMLSNDKAILQTLQRTVNELLEGELINAKFSNKLGKLFSHGGHMWLRALEKTANIHIIEDYASKSIRLYGSKQNCSCAKIRITQFLEDTENELVKYIPLTKVGNNRMLLKAVLMEYGANLEKFVELCELQSAVLDIKSCSLTLHGSRKSIEKAEEALHKLAVGLNAESFSEALSEGEACPICFSTVDLTFRLELCGHLYCSQCIQILVEQANFPIQCCSTDCTKELILDDIHKILGDDPTQLSILLEKSMKFFISKHQTDIFNCPAPDCPMFFYKKDIAANKINCPLCQNDLCVQCNVVFHQGFTCEYYQGSKNDPDYSFKVWKNTRSQCKQCPRCKTAIEKTHGCNNMYCSSCKGNFCWICVTPFDSEDLVYRHIHNSHPDLLYTQNL